MNRLIKRTSAVLSAAVMSFCGTIGNFTVSAEEAKEVKVIFDFVFDTEEIELGYRTDGKISDFNDFEPVISAPGKHVSIPLGRFNTKTHSFSGWTVDGFYGYTSGTTYTIPKDYAEDELVIKAVWLDRYEEKLVDIKYNLEYNGEPIERPEWLKDTKVSPGTIFEPDYTTIKVYDFGPDGLNLTSSGLTDGENVYKFGTKFVIGDEPMTFSPIWLREIDVTFTTGDVDRINGNTSVTFQKMESGSDELAANDRFSRNGFNLVGWTSSYDGEVYKPGQTVTFPGEDITYTAVWEPKNYVVVFKTGSGGTNKKVPGITDTTIICPDPEHTVEGKTFVGWKDSEGDIYPVGSEYFIKGAIPGSGISLTGVWVEGDELPVTTTKPVVTTTTTVSGSDTTTTTPVEVSLIGDANCDGKVTIADSTAILQAIGNPDKYGLTAEGKANADCCNTGDGITPADALSIKRLDAKLIEKLPEIIEG